MAAALLNHSYAECLFPAERGHVRLRLPHCICCKGQHSGVQKRRRECSADLAGWGHTSCACLLPPMSSRSHVLSQIDRAHKRTKTFSKDFAVKLKFAELPSVAS